MTIEEAIDRIEDHMWVHKIGRYPHLWLKTALDMAIAALRAQQNRGKRNCRRTPEVEAFEAEWLAWVHAGAPRQNGKPVLSERTRQKVRHEKEVA